MSISWEGSLILTISAGHEPMRSVYRFTLEQAVEFLKTHPEVLAGDLRAVDAVIRDQGETR